MPDLTIGQHSHQHGPDCGHMQISHEGHLDYLHDGMLHHESDGGYEEHSIEVSEKNPDQCQPVSCTRVPANIEEFPEVRHGDHYDRIVNGRLHHVHGDHCDDHGPITVLDWAEQPTVEPVYSD